MSDGYANSIDDNSNNNVDRNRVTTKTTDREIRRKEIQPLIEKYSVNNLETDSDSSHSILVKYQQKYSNLLSSTSSSALLPPGNHVDGGDVACVQTVSHYISLIIIIITIIFRVNLIIIRERNILIGLFFYPF